jgi:sialic acid synthase SpsE
MKKVSVFLSALFILFISFSSCNDAEYAANEKPKSFEERYKEIETSIKNNPEWMASIEKKAKERNIPVDSMMKLDIIWAIDDQDGKHKPEVLPVATDSVATKSYEERVKEMIEKIRNNKEWMATIKKKAEERKISLDSMLVLDARWSVDDQDGKHK